MWLSLVPAGVCIVVLRGAFGGVLFDQIRDKQAPPCIALRNACSCINSVTEWVFLYYLILAALKSKKVRKDGIPIGGVFALYPYKLPLFSPSFCTYFNISWQRSEDRTAQKGTGQDLTKGARLPSLQIYTGPCLSFNLVRDSLPAYYLTKLRRTRPKQKNTNPKNHPKKTASTKQAPPQGFFL